MNDLIDQGVQKINLCGGEPLVYKEIGRMIDLITDRGVDCYVNSNGTLVSKRINELKRIKCLAISIDGNREVNDSVRGKGTHDKIMASLEAAKNAGIPLQFAMVLGPHSLGQIGYMLDLTKKYNAVLNVIPLLPKRDETGSIEKMNYSDEFYNAIQKIRDLKAKGEPIACSTKSWDIFMNWPRDIGKEFIMASEGLPIPKGVSKCYAGRFYCLIDSNGDVFPCCSLVDVYKVGNVMEDKFDDLLKKMHKHPCKACCFSHSNEMNLMFSLDLSVINSLLKIYR